MRRVVIIWTAVIWVLASSALVQAGPYKAQEPKAVLGEAQVLIIGPENFIRIDGLDQNIDDILLAAQSPMAAILGIFAEPRAWKLFQDGLDESGQTGLHCHAIISTPAPLADTTVPESEFEEIKKDLTKNMYSAMEKERSLERALAGVTDHQAERAKGWIESFSIVNEGPSHLAYRFESVLEIKLKGIQAPRISRTTTVSSTILYEGKILNLQLMADPQGPEPRRLEAIAGKWRDELISESKALGQL